MIYYKLVKIVINILSLVKVIFNIIIKYYNILNFIINKKDTVFILKFLFLLYYFLVLNVVF